MYTQKPKTNNELQDISKNNNRKETARHDATLKGLSPGLLQTQENILQLQKTIGNKAVAHLLNARFQQNAAGETLQRMEPEEEELQMKKEQRLPQVQVQSRPAVTSGALPVAQLLLVRVRTASQGIGPRVISELKIEGRAPTTAGQGQGDHTVAEALMELALTNFIVGKSHAELAGTLIELLAHLDKLAQTRFKNEDSEMVKLDIDSIRKSIEEYQKMVKDSSVQGEDLNKKLEDTVEGFIRLWNKRAGAAYMRSSGKTTGGGQEKNAKKQIMKIGEEAEESGSTDELALDMANHVVTMIDFVIKDKKNDLEEAAKHIAEAIELAITAYPDIEFNYYDLMTGAVAAYAQKTKMDEKQSEKLFNLVHSKVTPYDEDDYEGYEEDEDEKMKEKEDVKKEDVKKDVQEDDDIDMK